MARLVRAAQEAHPYPQLAEQQPSGNLPEFRVRNPRASKLATVIACHLPPRAVVTPELSRKPEEHFFQYVPPSEPARQSGDTDD
jgi:hypothetical protein